MTYTLIISDRAEENLDQIVSYLDKEWSVQVRQRFLGILAKKVKQISERPLMFQSSIKRKSIRRCVVTKQIILYYKIKGHEVEIITIQDSRRDPKKLKF